MAGWSWKIDFHAHDLSSIKGCFWWKGFIGCWSIHFSLLTAHRSFLKPSPRGLINDWINLILMTVRMPWNMEGPARTFWCIMLPWCPNHHTPMFWPSHVKWNSVRKYEVENIWVFWNGYIAFYSKPFDFQGASTLG